jgi:hypothetical protein
MYPLTFQHSHWSSERISIISTTFIFQCFTFRCFLLSLIFSMKVTGNSSFKASYTPIIPQYRIFLQYYAFIQISRKCLAFLIWRYVILFSNLRLDSNTNWLSPGPNFATNICKIRYTILSSTSWSTQLSLSLWFKTKIYLNNCHIRAWM